MCIYSPMPHTLSYCALIGKCALIRSNTVTLFCDKALTGETPLSAEFLFGMYKQHTHINQNCIFLVDDMKAVSKYKA